MNKLDAISRRSSRMRALVRLIKIAITGCSACMLIASSTKLPIGGVTHAMESPEGDQNICSSVAASLEINRAQSMSSLDENYIVKTFFPETVAVQRPGPQRPQGWTGNAVTYDEDGDPYLYGEKVTHMTAMTETVFAPQTDAVSDAYLSDAIFIGNSLVVGLQKAAVVDATFYAGIGMSVQQFFTKENVLSPDGEMAADATPLRVSVAEALARDNDFSRVYLMFGINELGWNSANAFVSLYEQVIDTILSIRPDTVIYVQQILPINEEIYRSRADANALINNERIAQFNEAITAMAERKQVVCLIPGEAVSDENGQLFADATADGIHLNGVYLRKWVDYLKTHTVADVDLLQYVEDVNAPNA
ncbi:MAG: hypothetical protein IJC98_00200 [Clostridia bacterium]|nr:hypothetical protein [Clostridia bacterium]